MPQGSTFFHSGIHLKKSIGGGMFPFEVSVKGQIKILNVYSLGGSNCILLNIPTVFALTTLFLICVFVCIRFFRPRLAARTGLTISVG